MTPGHLADDLKAEAEMLAGELAAGVNVWTRSRAELRQCNHMLFAESCRAACFAVTLAVPA